MLFETCQFRADQVTKFYNSIFVAGWFHHPEDTLVSIGVDAPGVIGFTSSIGLPHGGVLNLGENLGFRAQFLHAENSFPADMALLFTTRAGRQYRAPLDTLTAEGRAELATAPLIHRFRDEMQAMPAASILDVGGRARSGAARRDLFNVGRYTVLDVLADAGVDVVGDAHTLTAYFPPESFDGILSISVFEHLLMPWAVAVQMNQVLKPGGLALVFSHQALGMHDLPWDFWRFSENAWDGLFNRHTGFEILDRAMDRPQFILPFIFSHDKHDAEAAVGYEGSCVLVRKIGPCQMTWPLAAADATTSMYPQPVPPAG
jgi:SAM-dependent methyltransferase